MEARYRPRSASTLSSSSTPTSHSSPLARRSRPAALQLSPSGSSIAPSALSSPRYQSFSLAPSQAGSAATIANATSTKFKRGHARGKAVKEGVVVKSANPDEVDLMALEDPDELFRLFGVRDVRGLEKRSRDAAEAKVADLRTMVGERYRDLLSAADSIVRMRTAAEKLVDRLDNVEAGVAITPELGSPIRRPSAARHSLSALDTPDASLSSPPTLSLTIHLLLSLPSLVHTLLESSSFLPAARIEGVGRVVYRELSTYSTDENEPGNLLTSFPIIEKNWESISSLGGVIVRRSMVDLRNWDSTSSRTAETLSAIIMLENTSLPSALTLLLDARSKALASVLSPSANVPKKRQHTSHEIDTVLKLLSEAIGVVLRTVESAREIFGLDGETGSLVQLLEEIENPSQRVGDVESTTKIRLAPTLSSLPNYPLLKRHLPSSILDFTPFLSITSSRNIVSPVDASDEVAAWLSKSTDLVVAGVASWISSLPGGAQTLSLIRNAIRTSLSLDAGTTGVVLRKRLEETVESCLDQVYKESLVGMVGGVSESITTLLGELDGSKADLDAAEFLIRGELPFPSTTMQPKSLSNRLSTTGRLPTTTTDPFEVFLERVMKRVEGRSPLVDQGVMELEGQAKRLREDLAGWLIVVGEEEGAEEEIRRLRAVYFVSARESLEGIHQAFATALEGVGPDVRSSLFIGNFALALSKSPSFIRDLLLDTDDSQETNIIEEWQNRLSTLQAQSLTAWKAQALVDALEPIEQSMTAATAPLGMTWDWEASRGLSNGSTTSTSIPSQPSSFILASLRSLSNSIRQIGPHRMLSDPTIVPSLLVEYRSKCAVVVRNVLGELEAEEESEVRRNKALQGSWDMRFLGRFWDLNEEWSALCERMMRLSAMDETTTVDSIDNSTLAYLQRTQTIFSPLLPPSSTPAQNATTTISQLLPLGSGPTSDFKSTIGVVKTGVRLGLLPTRS